MTGVAGSDEILGRWAGKALSQGTIPLRGHRSTSCLKGAGSDARVALLEAVCATITLELGRRNAPASAPNSQCGNWESPQGKSPSRGEDSSWASLDDVDLEDLFSQRIPMLKNCPHFFRGRLRHNFRTALEERCRAELEGDAVAEARACKLFAVVPIMLLSRPRGIGRIGRDELASRADQFARGNWRELIDLAVQSVLGRRVHLIVPSQDTVLVQPGWRKNDLHVGDSASEWEDTVLESHRTASTRQGGRGVEPRRDQRSRNAVEWNSSGKRAISGHRKNAGCGRLSSGYPICSELGKSSCSVPVLGATTLCERCLLAVRRHMRKGTTKECREQWTPCWGAFPEQKGSTSSRRCWQPCPCGWEGCVCVQHNEWPTQPVGLHGLTHCP